MLTLLEGGFYSTLHERLIESIIAEIKDGKRIYLIVPEQQTVMAECEMSEILSAGDCLSFEVTNFTRYCNTMFRTIGGISGEYSTPVAKHLMMWQTLDSLSETLNMTSKKKGVAPAVVDRAMRAIGEMQSLGFDVTDVESAKLKVEGNPRLYEKLYDLVEIWSSYKERSEKKFNDTAKDCETLAAMLKNDPSVLKDSVIFIDGFTSFTVPQYTLIGEMLKHIPVTVALTVDHERRGAFEFKELKATHESLVSLAAEVSVDTKIKKVERHSATASEPLAEISEMLWVGDGGEISKENIDRLEDGELLRIFSGANVYDEVDFIASDIKRRVMGGERYSDFAVVARDAKSYVGVIDVAFENAEIPCFISKTEDVTSTALIKMISSVYTIIAQDYKLESLITYLKSGLVAVDVDARDELELYLEKWKVEGTKIKSGKDFYMNPRGYVKHTDEDNARLLKINETRKTVFTPIIEFGERLKGAVTVREHAELLLDFLKKTETQARLVERSALFDSYGENELAMETLSLWGILCDALDTLVNVVGEAECDIESFQNQLLLTLNMTNVGRIPSFRDTVMIGSADLVRMKEKKHIYLIGCNLGEFPALVRENSYFTEKDKLELSLLGLAIEGERETLCARECYSFSRAFSKASGDVTLTYCERSAMAKPIQPSEVIGKIRELTGDRVSPVRISEIPLYDRVYTRDAALKSLSMMEDEDKEATKTALSRLGYDKEIDLTSTEIKNLEFNLGEDVIDMLFGKNIYLSETKISSYTTCPMQYLLRHELNIKNTEDAEIDSSVIGSFVHGVVENVFKAAKKEKKNLSDYSEEERSLLTERCAGEYVAALLGESESSARTAVTIDRLTRATKPVVDGLAEELGGMKYEPKFFELDLSYSDAEAPNPLFIGEAGSGVILKGKIDRVDTFTDGGNVYVRVVDYKTGSVEFRPSKLEKGEYLQMFIYLRAITETSGKDFRDTLGVKPDGKVIPAGVIYVKTKIDEKPIDRESDEASRLATLTERDGMILDDEKSIGAMNPAFLPPMEVKKPEDSRIYTRDEWQDICDTVDGVVMGIADGLRSGHIPSTPQKKSSLSCNFCPYKEICRNAKLGVKFN